MTDARYTYTAGMPAARVGWLVARARSIAGITDRDLASGLAVSLRTVRRWERGDLVPTDDEIEAIAAACGTRLTEFFPRRTSVSFDPATGIMRMGDQAIALPGTMLDNDAVLGAYIGLVRRLRRLRPDQDVKVRHDDLEALGEALDVDDDELEERLVRVIGISRTQAAAVRAQLLRRRLAVPMVGMLAALTLLGVNRIVTTATEEVRTVAGADSHENAFAATTTTAAAAPVAASAPTSAALAPDATAPTAPATLPAVVTESTPPASAATAAAAAEPQPEVRSGPPRSTRQRETGDQPTDPPTSEPTTVATTSPPATPSSPATAAPTTSPVTPAPTTTSSTPPPTPPTGLPPIGTTPVVQEPTTPPAPTTTTTTNPGPPTTTTTVPATTTTTRPGGGTLGGGDSGTLGRDEQPPATTPPTTTSATVPPPARNGPTV